MPRCMCLMALVLGACFGRDVTRADSRVRDDGRDVETTVACSVTTAQSAIVAGAVLTLGVSELDDFHSDAVKQLRDEINAGCGTTGTREHGTPIAVTIRDGQDDEKQAASLTLDLIQKDRAALLVGAGGTGPTVSSASAAIGYPYAAYFATGEELTGCTAAQLAAPSIIKSISPIYQAGSCWDHKGLFFRTNTRAVTWGRTAARYLHQSHPAIKRAVAIHRDDSLGVAIGDGFRNAFEGNGGSFGQALAYTTSTSTEGFKPLIKALVASDPELVLGVFRVGELKSFLEAYVELGKDPTFAKPAGFHALRFLLAGTLKTDYTAMSAAAIAAMADRAVGLEPGWDPGSEGFKKWLAAYRAFKPDAKVVLHTQMRAYDAMMILALAMTRANSCDASAIKAEYRSVANPPGEKVYPGEWGKARALIMAGKKINYEGASGPCDLAENGEVLSTPYDVWTVDATGEATSIAVYPSSD